MDVVTDVIGVMSELNKSQFSACLHVDRIGAARGTRTPDPRITNAMLYQLSYRGRRLNARIDSRDALLVQAVRPG